MVVILTIIQFVSIRIIFAFTNQITIIKSAKMLIEIQDGLGDALMCQPVIKEIAKHETVYLSTKYPELFKKIPYVICKASTDKKEKLFWYLGQKCNGKFENAFEQLKNKAKQLIQKIETDNIKFELDISFLSLFYMSFPGLGINKKVCIIKPPYKPQYLSKVNMYYENYAGDLKEIQDFIDQNKDEYYFISTGKDTDYIGQLKGINLDLENKLSLNDFLLLCYCADTFVSQLGHITAIACLFRKKLKVIKSNLNQPSVFENRYNATVIPDTCILI